MGLEPCAGLLAAAKLRILMHYITISRHCTNPISQSAIKSSQHRLMLPGCFLVFRCTSTRVCDTIISRGKLVYCCLTITFMISMLLGLYFCLLRPLDRNMFFDTVLLYYVRLSRNIQGMDGSNFKLLTVCERRRSAASNWYPYI